MVGVGEESPLPESKRIGTIGQETPPRPPSDRKRPQASQASDSQATLTPSSHLTRVAHATQQASQEEVNKTMIVARKLASLDHCKEGALGPCAEEGWDLKAAVAEVAGAEDVHIVRIGG